MVKEGMEAVSCLPEFFGLEGPEERAEEDAVEHQARDDDHRALPVVRLDLQHQAAIYAMAHFPARTNQIMIHAFKPSIFSSHVKVTTIKKCLVKVLSNIWWRVHFYSNKSNNFMICILQLPSISNMMYFKDIMQKYDVMHRI